MKNINMPNETNSILCDKFYIISEPKSTDTLREIFIARYPNGKADPS